MADEVKYSIMIGSAFILLFLVKSINPWNLFGGLYKQCPFRNLYALLVESHVSVIAIIEAGDLLM